MPTSYSPFRYPGGKSRLANYMKLVIRINRLGDVHYVEPFAGGGGLALALLFHGYARAIYLNDIDKAVYAFWHSATKHTDELCKRIEQVKVTMPEWERQQDVFRNANAHSLKDLGFAALFLNRTNRSGILKGGVIGGKAQSGKWRMDARFSKKMLIDKISMIGRHKNRIHISNMDALAVIKENIPLIKKNGFVYLDPPYFKKGQDLYENYYNEQDHKEIAVIIQKSISHPWIVSYDNEHTIREYYSRSTQITYGISYSAGAHYKGSEIMCFSPRLKIPPVIDPLLVKRSALKNP
jgi:DNA adenine methylase